LEKIELRPFDTQMLMGVSDAEERIIKQTESGISYTGIDEDGEIIIIGGVVILDEGLGSGWVITSERVLKHKIWFHRTIIDVLNAAVDIYNLHRIESLILKEHNVSMKWAKRLGFKQERLLEKHDSQGQDQWLYAWTE